MKIYLSPSIQKNNMGVGAYGSEEFRMNQIADVVQRELERSSEFTIYRNNSSMSLSQIIADSNSKKADIHLAIHSNAGGGKGCEVYAYAPNTNGAKLARILHDKISAISPASGRGVKYNSLAETRETNAIASLIEVAFHDNVDDANFIINNIEKIGIELARGVYEYAEISYTIAADISKKDFVKKLQTALNNDYKYSLVVDGIIGPLTQAKINNLYIKTGASAKHIIALIQELLNKKGNYGLAIDGIFGSKTLAAVKAFQKVNGLSIDGIVGKNTMAKLI